jgi:hypothetical protein
MFMKVLVNIITPAQVAEARETFPEFTGTFTISGQTFIPGEWVHVPDAFVIPANRKPFIKNVRWILRHLVRKYLREHTVHQFAQGILNAADLYGWDATTRTIPQAIIDLTPEEEIAEE